ncbi:tRNA pseudouridine synthase-like protein [Xylona heveae TC161]|uniref:tRNA pseudouridine synthase 1 n=1 Tax=Xylona heveae (strain CBS 132557 / TC161) TaxID=1328760 RepID=A0A165G033_XYLHT|nr:tRNA pseudouridine synthase-like protein [Xylona heveae TC161]KZF21584.1 tRNA pseudouridine synthase-like protein [Xylona heveae TC161]
MENSDNARVPDTNTMESDAQNGPATESPAPAAAPPTDNADAQPEKKSGKREYIPRNKRKDIGRNDWSRSRTLDKREKTGNDRQNKRRKVEVKEGQTPVLPLPFSAEEIAQEERKPKRKVAVLIGYSGSGYKGMQLNTTEKTIEGDIFSAFVAAGAISKANADDPKKSSLVRCARTDKGVHAAGNVISLKLIVEDPDIVKKINDNLSPQIRVWGMERTTGSFSCYQLCDSRIYEYLIPTHAFLPPHPQTYLGKKLEELADEANDRKGYEERQAEVSTFWAEAEEKYIKPILEELDEHTRGMVEKALSDARDDEGKNPMTDTDAPRETTGRASVPKESKTPEQDEKAAEKKEAATNAPATSETLNAQSDGQPATEALKEQVKPEKLGKANRQRLEAAIKSLKAAYIEAKKAYRIDPVRLQRVRDAFGAYVGTRNYHNFTIQKTFKDASAKRVIKSFVVGEKPIIINGTEWLSLKVHGQSFMMHQIRKMVSMATFVVRSGCPIERIQESMGPEIFNIPKAPGLGLLLERPIFDSYNEKIAKGFERRPIDFSKYNNEIEEFKQREIYERIFREEVQDNQFHAFFTHIDNFKSGIFLYLSSVGVPATREAQEALRAKGKSSNAEIEPDSEDEGPAGEGEG